MFADRADAGQALAGLLQPFAGRTDVVVLGLPRGGVPVAAEIARALGAPLDIILVRKLGVPFQPEVAMGAIGEGGVRVVDADTVRLAGVSSEDLADVERRERQELERRGSRYRLGRTRTELSGKVAIVVDDGLATGSTAEAACKVARASGAAEVVLAVPVAPRGWTDRLAGSADQLICLETPREFYGVGQAYRDFGQISDDEVVACLDRSATMPDRQIPRSRRYDGRDIWIDVDGHQLGGHVSIPLDPVGLVVFAHGSGSSRHSPRNRHVASVLHDHGFATLLFDLLTPAEAVDRANVFDVDLLGDRLVAVTEAARSRAELRGLPVGYFGASTGAAAALAAGARPDAAASAIVSRGGRPDLAGAHLAAVRAPTCLIVGGADSVVLELNRQARNQLLCDSEVVVVPSATHLFEEPGTLDAAAEAAAAWFGRHAIGRSSPRP